MTNTLNSVVRDYDKIGKRRNCTLPDEPDMEAIGRFVESVNRRAIMER